MGRKDKSKKGKGAEKMSLKKQKKLEKKLKKIEHESGKQTIEELLEEFTREQKVLTDITVIVSDPPSPRSHFTFTASIDSSELFLFGGEYFDGKKTIMYSDLYIYAQRHKSWLHVTSPNSPPPRSGHQAVFVKGPNLPASVWIFGGEFASQSQSRFYHYKDLWCLRIRTRKWEQIKPRGFSMPCARSGHRMMFWKSHILLFGGFNDTGRKTVYFNDLWQFNLTTQHWSQIKFQNIAPSPRSACMVFPNSDHNHLYIFGGYHKELVSQDCERGRACPDFFKVKIEKDSNTAICTPLRPSGVRPQPPRGSMSGVLSTSNRALVFGGVHDMESSDGESVIGYFHNDLYYVDLEKAKWYPFKYTTMVSDAIGNRSQPPAKAPPLPGPSTTRLSDGVFALRLNSNVPLPGAAGCDKADLTNSEPRLPTPRSSAGLALLGSTLYVYGGFFESGDRKFTLDDFYYLDLTNPVSWNCLYAGTQDIQEWYGSDLEDEDDRNNQGESDDDSGGKRPDGEDTDDCSMKHDCDDDSEEEEDDDGDDSEEEEDDDGDDSEEEEDDDGDDSEEEEDDDGDDSGEEEDDDGDDSEEEEDDDGDNSEEEEEEMDDSDYDEIVEDAPIPKGGESYSTYWDRTRTLWYQLMVKGLDQSDPDVVRLSAGRNPSPAFDSLAQRLSRSIFDKHTNSQAQL